MNINRAQPQFSSIHLKREPDNQTYYLIINSDDDEAVSINPKPGDYLIEESNRQFDLHQYADEKFKLMVKHISDPSFKGELIDSTIQSLFEGLTELITKAQQAEHFKINELPEKVFKSIKKAEYSVIEYLSVDIQEHLSAELDKVTSKLKEVGIKVASTKFSEEDRSNIIKITLGR